MEEDFLKYGDYITLYTDSGEGYLASIGFNSPEIFLQQCSKLHNSHIFNVNSMVFEVVPKLSYDAMKEQRREAKALQTRTENPNNQGFDQNDVQEVLVQQTRMQTLEKRVKMNDENNTRYRQAMLGRKVMYGQPIQLMHVDSGYFIQHAKRVS